MGYKEELPQLEAKIDECHPITTSCHFEFGPPQKHWYVEAVAVDPDEQSKGYGREIIEKLIALADSQGMDCYLEAGGEAHCRYYERFGFRVQTIKMLNDK